MYQALYRKWRPRTFDDVVGQDHITTTLRRQVETGRLSHAYLFIGTRGTGKTTCAKILARAVNCEHPVNGSPCNCCPSCLGIESGSIMDVVELDAASNNRVDDVRALQDEAIYTPGDVKKRVYIIDEVHMLSTAAFNALLKILEEPPEHLMFILCTTELRKVLPTIVSRCQRHTFKRIDAATIAARLLYVAGQEGLDLTQEAADTLAGLADGGMRDALSLLDQCSANEHIDLEAVHSSLGLAGALQIQALMDAVLNHDTESALNIFTDLWRGGKDPAGILNELSGLMRDILLYHTAHGSSSLLSGVYTPEVLKGFAARISASDLMDALVTVKDTDLAGTDPRRSAEICLVRLCRPETGDSVTALKRRISALESALDSIRKTGIIPAAEAPAPSAYAPLRSRTADPAPAVRPAAEQKPASAPAPVPIPAAKPAGRPAPIPDFSDLPPAPDTDVPPFYTDDDAPPETENDRAPSVPAAAAQAAPSETENTDIPSPVPAARPAPAAVVGSVDFWPQLLEASQGRIRMDTASMLRMPGVSGVLVGDKLTIYTGSPFMADSVRRNNDALNTLRELAAQLHGHTAAVEISAEHAPAVISAPVPVSSAPVHTQTAPAQDAPAPIQAAAASDTPEKAAVSGPAPLAADDPLKELEKFSVVHFEN